MATKPRSNVKSIEIGIHGKDGFTAVHHFEQKDRGKYTEPHTVPLKTHGELMDHIHEQTKGMGQQGDCPMCGSDEESQTQGDQD